MAQTQKYTAREFYLEDVTRTLFPLNTNKVLIEHGADKLAAYATSLISGVGSFQPQHRVFANKDALHLRRTVKLDAVAELFIYTIVYNHRNLFRAPKRKDRQHFGYRFENGRPISASLSYGDFKEAIHKLAFASEEYISFDISSYFNSIYHHDIVSWFGSIGADDAAVGSLGKLLRETNAGRSLDCLPQGLYPTKMIGNDFLRFIEESSLVRSKHVLRFMDDVYLFDDDAEVVRSDFAMLQKLIGSKGFSVNSSKTFESVYEGVSETDDQIDELKMRLLKRRREIMVSHYDPTEEASDVVDDESEDDQDDNDPEVDEDEYDAKPLSEEELEYVSILLNKPNLSEEDAELILVVTRDHAEILSDHLPRFAASFPHLAKHLYGLCKDIANKDAVASVIVNVVSSERYVSEFQLFWFGAMLESYLMETPQAPDLIRGLFEHRNSTDITKAKILEIPDQRYGLPDMRATYLGDGRSDWLAWSSAVGCRHLKSAPRNYSLKYFAKASPFNALIADIVWHI
ncbi:hypothetical protein LUX29_13090 [Aureimonas altamirensis]|uniref:antiviral reverse transcriptase Drt5 n=1 Tax=Aureimonas altamirensis TaxID=370622 RepID=UPI001E57C858|nr:antiviral reverse transcriptase Drt5 [Aureimonas altamirensis]UHD44012.1 hypothetical protein LUX29_13090 [Aureimonas altamirensis]